MAQPMSRGRLAGILTGTVLIVLLLPVLIFSSILTAQRGSEPYHLFGYDLIPITDDTMVKDDFDLFHTGDLVLILPTDDPALFKTNEIIAYSNGTDILVSRITKAEKNEAKENIAYRIKGDGEDIPKEERVKLDLTSVVGRYCLTIRNGTVWLNFFTNGLALLFSALLLFLIVLAFVLSSLLPRRHAARHQVAAPKPVKVPVKKESKANASRSELKAAAKPSAPKPEKNGNATETPVEPPLEKPARKPIRLVEGRVLRPEDRD